MELQLIKTVEKVLVCFYFSRETVLLVKLVQWQLSLSVRAQIVVLHLLCLTFKVADLLELSKH